MRLIVLDLEMNQPSEKIIQIGAVMCDTKRKIILSEFNEYVNPNEAIDPYITRLTGISQSMVDNKDSLHCVVSDFWAWVEECKCGKRIADWGGDVDWLRDQSINVGVNIPKRINRHNLKSIFEFVRDAYGFKTKGGLSSTLYTFGMDFEGSQHNALYDARNTARLAYMFSDMLDKYFMMDRIMNDKKKGNKCQNRGS